MGDMSELFDNYDFDDLDGWCNGRVCQRCGKRDLIWLTNGRGKWFLGTEAGRPHHCSPEDLRTKIADEFDAI